MRKAGRETERLYRGSHKGIDVVTFLTQVMEKCVWFYQQDFDYDIAILREAAKDAATKKDPYYWMGRPGGTWCLKEREIFLRDSPAHSVWTHYEPESTGIRAFRVELHSVTDGKVMGDVYTMNYPKQVQRVRENALPIDTVTVTFQNGETLTMPWEEYRKQRQSLRGLHGDILRQTYHPKSEEALTKLLALEHRIQQSENRNPARKQRMNAGETKTR